MPSDEERADELRKRILPRLHANEPWDLDADQELTGKAIELCGRDWFAQRQSRATLLARALELDLTRYAAESKLPFKAVEGEAIRLVEERRDGSPTIGRGVSGIRALLDPWLRFWLRRGDERTVWCIVHPDGLTLTGDPVAHMRQSLPDGRPRGW